LIILRRRARATTVRTGFPGYHGPIRIEQRSLDSLSFDTGSRHYDSPSTSFYESYGATARLNNNNTRYSIIYLTDADRVGKSLLYCIVGF
jgi:hypothetical protein